MRGIDHRKERRLRRKEGRKREAIKRFARCLSLAFNAPRMSWFYLGKEDTKNTGYYDDYMSANPSSFGLQEDK